MLQFDNVSKRYDIGAGRSSLRDALTSTAARLIGRHAADGQSRQEHWALREVSFRVQQGHALGIVGRNGAGKTTALKLLSRITRPTTGTIALNGRVSALIELGAGFHPDLSGLENIYLYGTILGLSRREIDAKLKAIIDFSELHTFIGTPVKRYSSGMYARLAFSVAAHADPDILLVDEVLAVGDRNFQQKCFDFIHTFVNSGHTTVFVSHDLYAVEQLCNELVWLESGRVAMAGEPSRVLERYLDKLDENAAEESEALQTDGDKLKIPRLRLSDATGAERSVFSAGEDVVVSVDYDCAQEIERPHFCVWISDSPAPNAIFAANMLLDGEAPARLRGRGTLQCVFKQIPLMPRMFYVWVEVWGADRAELLFSWQRLASFKVVDPSLLEGAEPQKGLVRFTKAHGPIRARYEWRLPPERHEVEPAGFATSLLMHRPGR